MLQDWRNGLKNRVKVTLTVEGGWTNQDSFDVDCNGLEELATVAKMVGVKLILVEVEMFDAPREAEEALWVVVAHMEQQEVMLEKLKLEGLDQLEGPILPLLKQSKRWKIERLYFHQDLDLDLFWTNLANIPTSGGHIGNIFFFPLTLHTLV